MWIPVAIGAAVLGLGWLAIDFTKGFVQGVALQQIANDTQRAQMYLTRLERDQSGTLLQTQFNTALLGQMATWLQSEPETRIRVSSQIGGLLHDRGVPTTQLLMS
jgi:hypothetical protein